MFVRLESPSGATSSMPAITSNEREAPEGDVSLTNIVSQSHNW